MGFLNDLLILRVPFCVVLERPAQSRVNVEVF